MRLSISHGLETVADVAVQDGAGVGVSPNAVGTGLIDGVAYQLIRKGISEGDQLLHVVGREILKIAGGIENKSILNRFDVVVVIVHIGVTNYNNIFLFISVI